MTTPPASSPSLDRICRTFRVGNHAVGGLRNILGKEHPRPRWAGWHAVKVEVSREGDHAKVVVVYSRTMGN